jgi:hypothetical protein
MRSAFSAPRPMHIELSYAATGPFLSKSCRFAGTSAHPPLSKGHLTLAAARVAPPHRAFVNRAVRRRDLSASIPSRNKQ